MIHYQDKWIATEISVAEPDTKDPDHSAGSGSKLFSLHPEPNLAKWFNFEWSLQTKLRNQGKMKPRNNKQESDSFSLVIFSPLSKVIVIFNLHKNFFEQLRRRKEKESPGVTVSTIPEQIKRIKENIVETTPYPNFPRHL